METLTKNTRWELNIMQPIKRNKYKNLLMTTLLDFNRTMEKRQTRIYIVIKILLIVLVYFNDPLFLSALLINRKAMTYPQKITITIDIMVIKLTTTLSNIAPIKWDTWQEILIRNQIQLQLQLTSTKLLKLMIKRVNMHLDSILPDWGLITRTKIVIMMG